LLYNVQITTKFLHILVQYLLILHIRLLYCTPVPSSFIRAREDHTLQIDLTLYSVNGNGTVHETSHRLTWIFDSGWTPSPRPQFFCIWKCTREKSDDCVWVFI